jgi:predicted RNA-binding Zn ribbon-like protein
MNSSVPLPAAEPRFLADHPALDFINTKFGVAEGRRECLGSDEDVVGWLQRSGLSIGSVPAGKRGTLLKAALELREAARDLVVKRKADGVGNTAVLNRYLALDRRVQQLSWKKGHPPTLETHQTVGDVEALLVPVAAAVAGLITKGDFELVRTCESSDCTMWFYDRTKAHHRRWCSMALCGNRAKVAAFRARKSPGTS